MRPQAIKDTNGNLIQLFATRAKMSEADLSGSIWTVMRKELRAALLEEPSAARVLIYGDAKFYVQLYARNDEGVFGCDNYARVPVKFFLPVKSEHSISPAVLRVGCLYFEGSHARAFYKWAVSKPAKKGGKR